jgi:hypothetical protein
MSVVSDIEELFVNTLALLIKESNINDKSQYQRGWLDGYARAYTQMTGESVFRLIGKANKVLEGSGKRLTLN